MHRTWQLLGLWRPSDLWLGAKEVFWIALFGLMPLWLALVILRAYGFEPPGRFFIEFIQGGDLLIVAAAIIGPLMYPLLKQYGETEAVTAPFPMNWIFVAGILLISVLASGFFYLLKGSHLTGATQLYKLDREYISQISYVCCTCSFVLTFFIVSLRNLMDRIDVPRYFRSDTEQLIEDWKK
jgi:hypothetical protein